MSTFPCPHLNQSPELRLSPSTSEGLSSKEMAPCNSEDPPCSHLWGLRAAPTSSLASTLVLASLCARKEGAAARPLSWPQPAAHCLATWLRLLKCHSLSGPHWACLLGPLRASVGVFTRTLPGLLAPHRLLSQALAAQNSFMGFPITGSHHSNSQPCWARPACAAGPGREGVGARLATGAWV